MAGSDLDAEARRGLKASDFALPPSVEDRRRGFKGSYPVDTEARARNALARGSQNLGRADLAKVVRAVYRKYPDIEISPELMKLAGL